MRGVLFLADAPPSDSAWALALLSGHILECVLKAFLSKVGVTEKALIQERDNCSALWEQSGLLAWRLPVHFCPICFVVGPENALTGRSGRPHVSPCCVKGACVAYT